ncbi:kinase-like domain-containing protein [Xylariaceae sp. FL0594]|nr:kinase-like domain-containing protein [Xylariaceae sp. FL0594]
MGAQCKCASALTSQSSPVLQPPRRDHPGDHHPEQVGTYLLLEETALQEMAPSGNFHPRNYLLFTSSPPRPSKPSRQHHPSDFYTLASLPTCTHDATACCAPTAPSSGFVSLLPSNQRAREVVEDPSNAHLLSVVHFGEVGINVGHCRSVSGENILASLGRNGDIIIQDPDKKISKEHCWFEINKVTGVVMFHDRSIARSSQVFGLHCHPFNSVGIRQVVVAQDLNEEIGLGGAHRDDIRFELVWHETTSEDREELKRNPEVTLVNNPRFDGTVVQKDLADDGATVQQSPIETRVHTPGIKARPKRHHALRHVGSGSFGRVWKTVDVDTGDIMAVKHIKLDAVDNNQNNRQKLKREVELHCRMDHPHIVELISFEEVLNKREIRIFMPLKDGSLGSLFKDGKPIQNNDQGIATKEIATTMSHHMLQALDYLAVHKVVHRDVKPDNILYTITRQKQYHFQLGDFGLSNNQSVAGTWCGHGHTWPQKCPAAVSRRIRWTSGHYLPRVSGHSTFRAFVTRPTVALSWTKGRLNTQLFSQLLMSRYST